MSYTISQASLQQQLSGNREICIVGDSFVEGYPHYPSILIEYFDVYIQLQKYDAVVCTSKNAVIALRKNVKFDSSIPLFVIAEGTGKVALELGFNVVYIGKIGYGDEFAHEIADMLKGKKVFFPRAKVVSSDVYGILKNYDIDIHESILYQTVCNKSVALPPKGSVLIFTSPSSVKCFLNVHEWQNDWIPVCIGMKTSLSFPPYINTYLSDKTTIDSCIEIAVRLSKTQI